LLIEEQRTNLLLQSEDFSTTWTSAAPYSVVTNTAVSPDGTQNADSILVANGSSSFDVNVTRQTVTKAASATQYTRSCYFKALGLTTSVRLVDFGSSTSSNASVTVSLIDGTVIGGPFVSGTFTGASVAVSNAGNGWWRVAFTYTTDTATSLTVRSFPYVGLNALTGNGTSGLLAWGAQLEAGAFPTSYIPTTTAAATRAADVALMQGANFSNWYNATENTLFVEAFTPPNLTAFPTVAAISDGSANNQITHYAHTSGYYSNVRSGGVVQGDPGRLVSPVTGTPYKFAVGLAVNNAISAANGATGPLDTSLLMPVGVNQMRIGANATGGSISNTHIKRIAYFPRRLANAELQAITS
jgi:hypothetical protein